MRKQPFNNMVGKVMKNMSLISWAAAGSFCFFALQFASQLSSVLNLRIQYLSYKDAGR